HQDGPDQRRKLGGVNSVTIENRRQRFSLLLAKTLGVVSNLGLERFAVVGERDEFPRDRGRRGVGAEPPQRPQWLRCLQHLRLHLEALFGSAAARRPQKISHGPRG